MSEFADYVVSVGDKAFFWFGGIALVIIEGLKRITLTKAWAERMRWEFWALAGLCIFIATFQAWHEEHQKALNEGAFLDGHEIHKTHEPNPFPIGSQLSLDMYWFNHGKSGAKEALPLCQIYVLDLSDPRAFVTVIAEWKTYFASRIKAVAPHESPIIFSEHPIACHALGPGLDMDTYDEIFRQRKKGIYVIGAVQFSDGLGKHEAHSCASLHRINEIGVLQFDACNDYVTQIDIK